MFRFFLICSPAGKSLVNDVVDKLYFTGASQVSDFDVSPKIVIDNNQITTQTVTGDDAQLNNFKKTYEICNTRAQDGGGLGVAVQLQSRNTPSNPAGYYMVPNKNAQNMYLDISAHYQITNLMSLTNPLTRRDDPTAAVVAEVWLGDKDGAYKRDLVTSREFHASDLGHNINGDLDCRAKIPANSTDTKVLGINMYVANIKADKIVLTDLNFGVWNGAVKYVD